MSRHSSVVELNEAHQDLAPHYTFLPTIQNRWKCRCYYQGKSVFSEPWLSKSEAKEEAAFLMIQQLRHSDAVFNP
jgi:hypothetical protein